MNTDLFDEEKFNQQFDAVLPALIKFNRGGCMKNFFKKLLLNAENKVSWMKLGGTVVGICGAIIALPTAGVVVPIAILSGAKIGIAVAAAIGISGTRDALTKK